jgi:uncharacterized membrane protein
MAEFVCMSFDSIDGADKALNELQLLRDDELAELADACVVRRGATGEVRLKQSVNLVAGGMVGGGVLGAVCGSLAGLLFVNPPAGMLVGAGVGAAAGAISGALSDYGIDDLFIEEAAASIAPGSSALFVLLRRADVDRLLLRLERYRPIVLHRSSSGGDQRRGLTRAAAEAVRRVPESADRR